jgi:dinuclear metal center YbgI/SA1388 family protein
MYPLVKDFLELLEQIAPTRLAEPWDNPGLQVGSYNQVVQKIFLALDPTLRSVRLAKKCGAQLLLNHHPLIFRPLSKFEVDRYPDNVVFEAASSGICVVAAHTNLDVAKGGINDILADMLCLQRVSVLKETNGEKDAGLGRVGDLRQPTPLSALVGDVKEIFGAENLNIVGRGTRMIRRLAVVGGSGGSMVALASRKGADLLLTGDVSHHNALEAKHLGIALIDGGHFYTESLAFRRFAKPLKDALTLKGWESAVEVDDDELSPMQDG